ncbi:MAG: TerD family protein [Paraclostridium sp.]
MINLTKGNAINLNKDVTGSPVTNVHFTVQWDSEVDMDIHAVVLKDGKGVNESDFIYFRNLVHSTGAVKHSGDIRNGKNVMGTDDEIITVNLNSLAQSMPDRDEVLFTLDIYDASAKGIDFGDVGTATCKVINADTNEELVSYRVDKDLLGEICAKVARFKKQADNTWTFEALGQGVPSLEGVLVAVGLM